MSIADVPQARHTGRSLRSDQIGQRRPSSRLRRHLAGFQPGHVHDVGQESASCARCPSSMLASRSVRACRHSGCPRRCAQADRPRRHGCVVSGVRRSWLRLFSKAVRSFWVSAWASARAALAARRTCSNAMPRPGRPSDSERLRLALAQRLVRAARPPRRSACPHRAHGEEAPHRAGQGGGAAAGLFQAR